MKWYLTPLFKPPQNPKKKKKKKGLGLGICGNPGKSSFMIFVIMLTLWLKMRMLGKMKRRKDSYTYKIISCFINGEKSYGTNI